jgi:hypothetical protein
VISARPSIPVAARLGRRRVADVARVGLYGALIVDPRLPPAGLTEGDRVRFNVKDELPESTTIHWHGLVVLN